MRPQGGAHGTPGDPLAPSDDVPRLHHDVHPDGHRDTASAPPRDDRSVAMDASVLGASMVPGGPFRLLADRSPVGIFVDDGRGTILYVNDAAASIGGATATTGGTWLPLIHDDDLPAVLAARERAAREPVDLECRMVTPDGDLRWLRVGAAPVLAASGAVLAIVGTVDDITSGVHADRRREQHEERLRAVVETAAEGIVTVDAQGIIAEFNSAAERIFGVRADEVIGTRRFMSFIAPSARDELVSYMRDYFADRRPRMVGQGWRELPGVRADGSELFFECSASEIKTGDERSFTIVVHDVTDRRRIERELEHVTTHDTVTGLANRLAVAVHLEGLMSRSAHGAPPASVHALFVQLDGIDAIAESMGHLAADDMIRVAAARLQALADPAAIVGRFANDRFVFVSDEDVAVADVVQSARRIIEAMAEPVRVGTDEAILNASIGIEIARIDQTTPSLLLANAEAAMNQARSRGRDQYELFDPEIRRRVQARRRTEVELRRASELAQLELHYQPVVSLHTGAIEGFEALVRWNHPTSGLQLPGSFIPLAEESGLIGTIGAWVIHEATAQLARWRDLGCGDHLTMGINLSMRQLGDPALTETVQRSIQAAGVCPDRLIFEVTETALPHDLDAARAKLADIKAFGVQLALDDYGTGYSSLAHVIDLPIDVLKIDQSFVADLARNRRSSIVVATIIALAAELDATVIAEGIEEPEQARLLHDEGCELGQGFLFSHPRAAADLHEILLDGDPLSGYG
jgi:PAS domain S-box-containing protein/diguanylate cyclase (GGDEF)-like protein